jgi:N-acetylglucosamine-6-phosphate deacetylase
MDIALSGARVFDGEHFHNGVAVVIESGRISKLGKPPKGMRCVELEGGILAPGFVDVQVNGGGGALLNDRPSVDAVDRIAESHRRFGTVALLPTVITDAPTITEAAIAAVRASNHPAVIGIHVEGPFLDPLRKGAHDAQFIRSMTEADIALFAKANCGKFILTVAPNKVSPDYIRQLSQCGIRISLGHSDATYDQANQALVAGASAFTHLFNAMSQMTGREPGMVGAALRDNGSYIGIIADGHHVHDDMLRLAFAATPCDRFMLISDAMPSAAGGPDQFTLQGRAVTRNGSRLQLADGTLAGSTLTMDAALRYTVQQLSVPLDKALRMSSTNPARFLGLQTELGLIAPGARASLVHLNDALQVQQTWIDGA